MRNNLPVTGVEYDYPASSMLVSATNLSSHIEYCNPAFIEVSGFSREELIGQPHNVIRHPDMPPQAFEDMWATIKAGRSWTALVKNRRKNGDHYWVRANVTPIVRHGETVGYLSVRTRPERAEIREAEALYARLRSGHAKGVCLRGGRVVHVGALHALDLWRDAGLPAHIFMTGAVGMAAVASLFAFADRLSGATLVSAALAMVAAGTWLPACFVARRAQRRIAEVDHIAARMAAGDLTVEVPATSGTCTSQTLRGLAQLRVSLVAIVSDVRTQIEQMKVASQEISGGNMDLSRRTEVQAASLEETAASLEELTATVKSNSHAATQANSIVESAQTATRGGCDAIRQTESTMQGISRSSDQIRAIVTTIDSIAFQTNILALNAAVEAARAGETGKGFAVVAGEVRGLAQRCATAAREIKEIVDTNATVAQAAGESVAGAAGRMVEIESNMQRVYAIVQEIANASVEQSQGIDSINNSVVQLDDATQQNAALVEEGAATAESLANQANVLDEAVRLFTLPNQVAVRSR
ncbi:methyl-accepting chemotaxis protein [Paraburkholderia sp. SUR17]|uniref:methyl-accepting chemotaxis protein n=1 Tax=Paraburkholderia sp. SUR17 TaxID=3034358 RepID=UPI002407C7AC|nr:methyl-accepting chemotaxis protein [Paraburkholderia sp. SUR17]WEY39962.1 methyl-accepting chemotaxis protein [Paraburkholderia sp. SUR17]